MRLLISGGGTGGHVYPALAVADAIRKRANADPATPLHSAHAERDALLYIGRAGSIEERLAHRAQISFRAIEVGGVRGLDPITAARNLGRVLQSIGRARAIIREFQPHAIFATGGYVSAPVIWAGALEKIPRVIYLPDLEPGWAIRATARWATRIAISFPEVGRHFAKAQSVVTGYPVRAEFYQTNQARARQMFDLDPRAPTVAIFGGSRGAHRINQAVVANLVELAQVAQIIHIAGREDEAWVKAQARAFKNVRVFGYLDDELPHALAAADVVIARAGAASLGEFPVLGVPAMLVPYPYAGRHQELNARFLVARGAAIRVDDAELSEMLLEKLKNLFDAPEKRQAMSAAMRALAQPRAAENIAELLEAIRK